MRAPRFIYVVSPNDLGFSERCIGRLSSRAFERVYVRDGQLSTAQVVSCYSLRGALRWLEYNNLLETTAVPPTIKLGSHPTPRVHTSEPCRPHISALGDPGEGMGHAAQLGEWGAWKVAVPALGKPRLGLCLTQRYGARFEMAEK